MKTNEINTYFDFQKRLQQIITKLILKLWIKKQVLWSYTEMPKNYGDVILICFKYNDNINNYFFIKHEQNYFISPLRSFDVDKNDYGEIKWSQNKIDSETIYKIIKKHKYDFHDLESFDLQSILPLKEFKKLQKQYQSCLQKTLKCQEQYWNFETFSQSFKKTYKYLDKMIYKYFSKYLINVLNKLPLELYESVQVYNNEKKTVIYYFNSPTGCFEIQINKKIHPKYQMFLTF